MVPTHTWAQLSDQLLVLESLSKLLIMIQLFSPKAKPGATAHVVLHSRVPATGGKELPNAFNVEAWSARVSALVCDHSLVGSQLYSIGEKLLTTGLDSPKHVGGEGEQPWKPH